MEINIYKRGDYKKAINLAQWVFFIINEEYIEIVGGIGKYNYKDNTIEIYDYDLNNVWVGGKLRNHGNTRKSINELNELNYIGKYYIKIYGSVDKLNENKGEIVNLFDNYIKSETVHKYAEKYLCLKDNKWTIEILSKLPVPSRYTTENVINALNKLDNKLLDNKIDNQTLIKEWKFWIPTIIAISSAFMAIGSLICSIINILSN